MALSKSSAAQGQAVTATTRRTLNRPNSKVTKDCEECEVKHYVRMYNPYPVEGQLSKRSPTCLVVQMRGELEYHLQRIQRDVDEEYSQEAQMSALLHVEEEFLSYLKQTKGGKMELNVEEITLVWEGVKSCEMLDESVVARYVAQRITESTLFHTTIDAVLGGKYLEAESAMKRVKLSEVGDDDHLGNMQITVQNTLAELEFCKAQGGSISANQYTRMMKASQELRKVIQE